MSITHLIIQTLFVLSITYFLFYSSSVERKKTLSKNLSWLKTNSAFLNTYLHPDIKPMLLISACLLLFLYVDYYLMFYFLAAKYHEALHIAYLLLYSLYLSLHEKGLQKKIPLPDIRSADLTPRNIGNFLSRKFIFITWTTALLVYIANFFLILTNTISHKIFLANVIYHSSGYMVLALTVMVAKKEKAINRHAVAKSGIQNLEFLSRQFNYKLIFYATLFLSCIFLLQVSGQLFGKELCEYPMKYILAFLGGGEQLDTLINFQYFHDYRWGVAMAILLYIPNSELYAKVRKIKIETLV